MDSVLALHPVAPGFDSWRSQELFLMLPRLIDAAAAYAVDSRGL